MTYFGCKRISCLCSFSVYPLQELLSLSAQVCSAFLSYTTKLYSLCFRNHMACHSGNSVALVISRPQPICHGGPSLPSCGDCTCRKPAWPVPMMAMGFGLSWKLSGYGTKPIQNPGTLNPKTTKIYGCSSHPNMVCQCIS